MPRRRHIREVLRADGDTVIPPFHDDDGTDGSALQYEVFMNAKRALPPPVSAEPFNPGGGVAVPQEHGRAAISMAVSGP